MAWVCYFFFFKILPLNMCVFPACITSGHANVSAAISYLICDAINLKYVSAASKRVTLSPDTKPELCFRLSGVVR